MEGKGFVENRFLQTGHILCLSTGKEALVEEILQEAQGEKVLVHNANYGARTEISVEKN